MRPIKLTLTAFGPYSGEAVFELDKLGEKGIYLITGDTGAGKTTIFDGIVYALYGEPSGEMRNTSMLRSKYASDTTKTSVELDFLYNDEVYSICRCPEYERKKQRGGEGMTVEKKSVELKLPNGTILTRSADVDNKIREILGLDRSQFMQIAMIAQGDFAKLIKADTKERQQIFRQIFNTEKFVELQNEVSKQFSDISKSCEKTIDSAKQYLNGVSSSSNDNDEYREAVDIIEAAKNGDATVLEAINAVEKLISYDENSYDKVKTDIKKIEKDISTVTSQTTKAIEIENDKKRLDYINKKHEELKLYYEEASGKLSAEEANEPKIKQIEEKITLEKDSLPKYQELEEKEKQEKSLSEKYNSLEIDLTKTREKVKNTEDNLLKNKELFKTLKDSSVELTKAETEFDSIKKAIEDGKKVELDHLDVKKIYQRYKEIQEKYLEAKNEADRINKEYNEKFNLYMAEQAGVLAGLLEESKPCPVCGSTSHPMPAKVSDETLTREYIDKLKDISDKAMENQAEISKNAAAIGAELEKGKEAVFKKAGELFNLEEDKKLGGQIADYLASLDDKKKAVNAKVTEAKEKQEKYDKLENIIPKYEDELKNFTLKISELEKDLVSVDMEIKENKKSIENLKKKLVYKNKAEAKYGLEKLISLENAMKDSLEKAKNAVDSIEKNIANLSGEANGIEKRLNDLEKIDVSLENLRSDLSLLENNKKEKQDEEKNLIVILDANKKSLKGLKEKQEELGTLEEKIKWVGSLNKTLSGTLGGKEKIMLETYVQMGYFDKIISRANTRLMSMTNGQYELVRKVEGNNKRSQSGLELDVIDHYNGTVRSAKSLSGGESFKASLSLALGLSDEIQSSAGGIKLDAMFIDEGFGSLDEDSLKQAISTLVDLTEGNRLIGIISHVTELKERIDKQIVVTKEKVGGSKAKIIC